LYTKISYLISSEKFKKDFENIKLDIGKLDLNNNDNNRKIIEYLNYLKSIKTSWAKNYSGKFFSSGLNTTSIEKCMNNLIKCWINKRRNTKISELIK